MPRTLRRTAGVLAALVLLTGAAGCGDDGGGGDDTASDRSHEAQPENPDGAPCQYLPAGESAKKADPPADTAAYTGTVDVTVETNKGDIGLTLDAASAPCTVNSFTSLTSQGYYDDTPCHRLTAGGLSVLQCGDPSGSGSGGPGYSYSDELSGGETYPAGTLAMANSGPNTNGSQFFMVYDDSQLPPSYTVFGTIDEDGQNVLRDIADAGVEGGGSDGAPAEPVTIEFVEVGESTEGSAAPPSESAAPTGCTYSPDGSGGAKAPKPPAAEPAYDGDVEITLDTTQGEIALTLDGAAAPCTVSSFVSLAEQGFFDKTRCHRLTTPAAGLGVLQCGDPTGTGTGGPGYTFADELTGTETYGAGTLAMANAGPNTNGSQFFMVYSDSQLPPSYTVFGQLSPEGLAVVEKVGAAGDRTGAGDGPPKLPVVIRAATVEK